MTRIGWRESRKIGSENKESMSLLFILAIGRSPASMAQPWRVVGRLGNPTKGLASKGDGDSDQKKRNKNEKTRKKQEISFVVDF